MSEDWNFYVKTLETKELHVEVEDYILKDKNRKAYWVNRKDIFEEDYTVLSDMEDGYSHNYQDQLSESQAEYFGY